MRSILINLESSFCWYSVNLASGLLEIACLEAVVGAILSLTYNQNLHWCGQAAFAGTEINTVIIPKDMPYLQFGYDLEMDGLIFGGRNISTDAVVKRVIKSFLYTLNKSRN